MVKLPPWAIRTCRSWSFANNSILSPHGWVCRLMRDSFSEEMGASTRQLQIRLKDTKNIRPLHFGQVCSELTPQTRSVCVLLPINRCATTNFSKRALFCHRLVIARRWPFSLQKETDAEPASRWLSVVGNRPKKTEIRDTVKSESIHATCIKVFSLVYWINIQKMRISTNFYKF